MPSIALKVQVTKAARSLAVRCGPGVCQQTAEPPGQFPAGRAAQSSLSRGQPPPRQWQCSRRSQVSEVASSAWLARASACKKKHRGSAVSAAHDNGLAPFLSRAQCALRMSEVNWLSGASRHAVPASPSKEYVLPACSRIFSASTRRSTTSSKHGVLIPPLKPTADMLWSMFWSCVVLCAAASPAELAHHSHPLQWSGPFQLMFLG